jgi:Protein of unknown function (DUF3168)
LSATIVQQAIFQHLTTAGEVFAILGRRVYPVGETPEKAEYPLIMYRVSTVVDHPSETSQGDTNDTSTFRFFCTDTSAWGAALCAKALKKRLNGSTFTVDQVFVHGCHRISEADFNDDETGFFQTIAEYEIHAEYLSS